MKKLLAIVMVVAMMFSMSVVAMADENPWTASVASVEETEAGTLAVTLNAKGDLSNFEVRVYYTGTTVELNAKGKPDVAIFGDLKDCLEASVTNDVTAESYAVMTGATTDATIAAYEGTLGTIVFAGEGTIKIVDGISGAVIAENIEIKAPVVATPVPATQAPATQAPATQAPATQAPATQAPATQAPTTPSNQNGTTAPQTADVAPVATMITLVVVAGLAIVALKKRATN